VTKTGNERHLLERLLDTPHLAHVVPRLQPEVLHRVIQTWGLEDCGELVALATPSQLSSIFDLDLWRPARAGLDEELDAARFGLWLEVLLESGPECAAEKLAGMDVELVIAALAQHIRVFDLAALPSALTDGEEPAADRRGLGDGSSCEIAGYSVEARRTDAWDAIVAVLIALDADHAACFDRVMRGCRRLSNSTPEIDGLDDLLTDSEQDLFELTIEREQRREEQGYATPAQARAFLQMARQIDLRQAAPPPSPIVRAYFGAVESAATVDADAAADGSTGGATDGGRGEAAPPPSAPLAATENADPEIAAGTEILLEAGVLAQPPRALLEGSHDRPPRFACVQGHMQRARDLDPDACSRRTEELAYLVNTLVAGCAVQTRPIEPREASDAVVAVCNLGLENWPSHWLTAEARRDAAPVDAVSALPEDFLVHHDLVAVFQVGWTVLYRDVAMFAAERLIGVLANLKVRDRESQGELDALRTALTRRWREGAPWLARDALDVVMILDMPAWAALRGLIDEFPVVHAGIAARASGGIRAVSASAFEFISENRQIASVRGFLETLPTTLGGEARDPGR